MCRRSSQNSINLSRSSRMLSWSIKCNPGNLKGFYSNYGNPFPIYSTVPATLHYTQINHQWTLHWTVWLLLMSCCTHSLRQTNQTNLRCLQIPPFPSVHEEISQKLPAVRPWIGYRSFPNLPDTSPHQSIQPLAFLCQHWLLALWGSSMALLLNHT